MPKPLVDTFLRGLKKPAKGRLEYADGACRGLEFRLTAAGARSWSFRYRAPVTGKLSRATIGPYPTISLADARLQADALRKAVASGQNPSEAKRQAKREAPGRTFRALSERYLAEHARRTKKSADRDERNLDLHVLPKWSDRDFASIRRRDVIDLIEGIIAAGTPVLANRIHSLVSVIFSFAVDSDLRDDNPCTRLKKRGEERPGQRVLSDAEIRLFWQMVVEPPAMPQTGQGLRLALLTGTRVGEVAGYHPREVQGGLWTIPGDRTKNGLDHIVPLSAAALDIIGGLVPVMPAAYAGAMKRISGRLCGRFGGDDERSWKAKPPTPHDLRRTFRTRLPQIGVPADIRDRLMNHMPTDVGSKHYDRYQYLEEKRAALNLWDATLQAILRVGG